MSKKSLLQEGDYVKIKTDHLTDTIAKINFVWEYEKRYEVVLENAQLCVLDYFEVELYKEEEE